MGILYAKRPAEASLSLSYLWQRLSKTIWATFLVSVGCLDSPTLANSAQVRGSQCASFWYSALYSSPKPKPIVIHTIIVNSCFIKIHILSIRGVGKPSKILGLAIVIYSKLASIRARISASVVRCTSLPSSKTVRKQFMLEASSFGVTSETNL